MAPKPPELSITCHMCGYDGNSITAIRCDLCKQPLELNIVSTKNSVFRNSAFNSKKNTRYRPHLPKTWLALVSILSLLVGGSLFYWRSQTTNTQSFLRLRGEGSTALTLLGDTFSGYSTFRSERFRQALKELKIEATDNPELADKLMRGATNATNSGIDLNRNQTTSNIGNLHLQGEIEFQFGSANLTSKGKQTLNRIAKKIAEFNSQTVAVRVIGHASRQGLVDLNQKLSQQRAQEVINYLKQRGLQHEMVAVGKGFSQLRAGISPYDNRNQRTEIQLLRLKS